MSEEEITASEFYDADESSLTYGTSWSDLLDEEAFATTPFGWFKSSVFTAIGSSVIATQFNLEKHDILPRLAWRFPSILKTSWQYISGAWSQPRTCALCRKQFFWADGPLKDARCWQCNRVFHDKCLWQAGIKPPPTRARLSQPWFHSSGCFKVDFLLRQSIVESPLKFRDGLSMSFVLRGMNPTPQQMRKNLDAWNFFSKNFPDFPAHPSDPQLYVFLNKGKRAVSGAVLELFGQDLAHIKFVTTQDGLRGLGLYSQLQELLEVWLEQLGVAKIAVSSFPGTQPLWTRLGFPEEHASSQQLDEWLQEYGCDVRMGSNAVLVKKLGEAATAQDVEHGNKSHDDAGGTGIHTHAEPMQVTQSIDAVDADLPERVT